MGPAVPEAQASEPHGGRTRRVVLTVIALAALSAVVGTLAVRPSAGGEAPSDVGRAAPDFALQTIGGRSTVRLKQLRGQVVVLNFWASWCAPCRSEAPALADAYMSWHLAHVVFLGISYQDGTPNAEAFARREGISYPLVIDPGAKVAGEYGVSGVPETIVISKSGVILQHAYGAITGGQLDSWIGSAVGERMPAASTSTGSAGVP
jgi:cytochrome c biogenesis protein CcmG/thiol:disulfide interchange protein DsbE